MPRLRNLLVALLWITAGLALTATGIAMLYSPSLNCCGLMVLGFIGMLVWISVTESWETAAAEKKEQLRREWEESPEGQAHLQRMRREAAALERNRELLARLAAGERRRQAREAEEQRARLEWNKYFSSATMREVDEMAGLEFEAFLVCLLAKMGYTDLEITKINDMGGDIVCRSPTQEKVVVQAKRWRGSVGVQAVQEVLGAALYYEL